MVPHLIRAQSTYKDIRIHSFHYTYTHTHTHAHTHTHTHTHTNTCIASSGLIQCEGNNRNDRYLCRREESGFQFRLKRREWRHYCYSLSCSSSTARDTGWVQWLFLRSPMPSPERPNKSPAVVRSQSLAASYSRRGESQINACSSLNTWQKCRSVSQKKKRGSISCRMSTVNTTTSAHEHMGMQLLKCLSSIKLCKSTYICFPTTNCKCTGIFYRKMQVSASGISDKGECFRYPW